jgi:hypothetical protein
MKRIMLAVSILFAFTACQSMSGTNDLAKSCAKPTYVIDEAKIGTGVVKITGKAELTGSINNIFIIDNSKGVNAGNPQIPSSVVSEIIKGVVVPVP